ncbi:hypothetical protein BaRGS_00009127, partial [Batillaria attramentaria]
CLAHVEESGQDHVSVVMTHCMKRAVTSSVTDLLVTSNIHVCAALAQMHSPVSLSSTV